MKENSKRQIISIFTIGIICILQGCSKPIIHDEGRFIDNIKSIKDTTLTKCDSNTSRDQTLEVYAPEWLDYPISTNINKRDTFVRYRDTELNIIHIQYINRKK